MPFSFAEGESWQSTWGVEARWDPVYKIIRLDLLGDDSVDIKLICIVIVYATVSFHASEIREVGPKRSRRVLDITPWAMAHCLGQNLGMLPGSRFQRPIHHIGNLSKDFFRLMRSSSLL